MLVKTALFAVAMLAFGTINTVTTKLQSACMFLGEFACLVPYFCTYMRRKPKRPEGETPSFRHESLGHKMRTLAVFALPALCDSGATTLLNIGLLLTYASVFQMLRGTMVVFTGILTVTFLKRRLHTHHWLGIVLITAGAAIVGASSVIYSGRAAHQHSPHSEAYTEPPSTRQLLLLAGRRKGPTTAPAPLLGDLLIIAAQVLQATQFIVEEKYLAKYRVPALLAVGLEGLWGLVICAVALPILTAVHGPNKMPLDSLPAAVREIAHSKPLQWSTFGSIASIAFFNYFGISVTKQLSGAARATIDASRTVFVWVVSLWLGWEYFHGLEVLGFLVILSGSSLYNELIRSCLPKSAVPDEANAAEEPLLAGEAGSSLPPLPPTPGRSPSRVARPQAIRPSPYSLARSLRAGPSALSPHSLTGPARSPMEFTPPERRRTDGTGRAEPPS